MEIRLLSTGQVLTENEFKDIHPETSFPPVLSADLLAELGAEPVFETPQPTPGPFQTVVRNGTTIQDGKRVMAWAITDWSAAQITAAMNAGRASAIRNIDADVDAIYEDVIGQRAMEYADAEQAASDFKAAGYNGAVPSDVQSWATAKGWTAKQAADDILAQAAAWRAAKSAMRANRLASKEAVRKATTLEQIQSTSAAWASFVTTIRGQLGV